MNDFGRFDIALSSILDEQFSGIFAYGAGGPMIRGMEDPLYSLRHTLTEAIFPWDLGPEEFW